MIINLLEAKIFHITIKYHVTTNFGYCAGHNFQGRGLGTFDEHNLLVGGWEN